ncbi:MAG: hypothetical protein ACRDRL_17310, partial [Sciscionella sp.]
MGKRAPLVTALVAALALSGCSSVSTPQPAPHDTAASPAAPAHSPPTAVPAKGNTVTRTGSFSALTADSTAGVLAALSAGAPRLELFPLAGGRPRTITLPGVAGSLSMAKAGDELVLSVPSRHAVLSVNPRTGARRSTAIDGAPSDAIRYRGALIVCVPAKHAVEVYSGVRLVRTITGKLTPTQVVNAGGHLVVLDRNQSAVFDLDAGTLPAGAKGASADKGSFGNGQRSGNGAANAVADSYGRVLTTDVADGALLAFKPA